VDSAGKGIGDASVMLLQSGFVSQGKIDQRNMDDRNPKLMVTLILKNCVLECLPHN
jgi:hypothetical protein